jgi:predicted MPP superfamily phosphohydrolase
LAASLLVRSVVFFGLTGAALLARHRRRDRPDRRRGESGRRRVRASVALFALVNVGFSLAQLDAYVVEPLAVEMTELSLALDHLDPALPPVRVVHITDTHIERYGFREMDVVRRVNALQPDLVVLTGDYLNLSNIDDPQAAQDFRHFVAQLEAPYGIYAVRGSVEVAPDTMARLLEGTPVVWLEQEAVTLEVRGQRLALVGVACSHRQELDAARLAQAMSGLPDDAFTLLLYHSPDLIHEAAAQGVDLYLAGHTHGGQLRLPFYGAIVTFSRYGRRYASGLFEEAGTRMYVSRGLGFEGGGMPRARFLCRPEVVSLELTGTGN